MSFLAVFLEGVVTFLSPCLLPLLPVYLAYFAGGVDAQATGETDLRATVMGAFGFVAGFALVFMLMGAFAGAVGALLVAHRALLDALCGCVVVVLGLGYLGVLHISLPWRGRSLNLGRRGPVGALLLGMTFAVGWSPCVGTFLASALSLAAQTGSASQGVLMLACFSLGLGMPFVLAAVLLDRLEGVWGWVRRHYDLVNRICGVLLVALGLLMASGLLGSLILTLVP